MLAARTQDGKGDRLRRKQKAMRRQATVSRDLWAIFAVAMLVTSGACRSSTQPNAPATATAAGGMGDMGDIPEPDAGSKAPIGPIAENALAVGQGGAAWGSAKPPEEAPFGGRRNDPIGGRPSKLPASEGPRSPLAHAKVPNR
jgi:hypothetical protein